MSDTITLQGPLCSNCRSNHMQTVLDRQDGSGVTDLWHCICGHCTSLGDDLDDVKVNYDGEDVQYV